MRRTAQPVGGVNSFLNQTMVTRKKYSLLQLLLIHRLLKYFICESVAVYFCGSPNNKKVCGPGVALMKTGNSSLHKPNRTFTNV
jgi:hypothetical protein